MPQSGKEGPAGLSAPQSLQPKRAKGPLTRTTPASSNLQTYTTKPTTSGVLQVNVDVALKKRWGEPNLFASDDVPFPFLDEQVLEKKRAAREAAGASQ